MRKIIIYALLFLNINMAFGFSKDEPCAKELEVSNYVDAMIVETNKLLPITIEDNVIEQVSRSGKNIYATYVLTKYHGQKLDNSLIEIKIKAVSPLFCSMQQAKSLSDTGYNIIAIYYTPEKKEIDRKTFIIKDICASFQ